VDFQEEVVFDFFRFSPVYLRIPTLGGSALARH
jgi:hypothetical protein